MYPVQMEGYFLNNDIQLSHMVFMILNIIGTYLMDNCVLHLFCCLLNLACGKVIIMAFEACAEFGWFCSYGSMNS